jgi:hypothetical protein
MYLHSKHVHPSVLAVMESQGCKQVLVPASVRKVVSCKVIGESLVLEGYSKAGRKLVVEADKVDPVLGGKPLFIPINEHHAFALNADGEYEVVSEGVMDMVRGAIGGFKKMWGKFKGALGKLFGKPGEEDRFLQKYNKDPKAALNDLRQHLISKGIDPKKVDATMKTVTTSLAKGQDIKQKLQAKDPGVLASMKAIGDARTPEEEQAAKQKFQQEHDAAKTKADRDHELAMAKQQKAPNIIQGGGGGGGDQTKQTKTPTKTPAPAATPPAAPPAADIPPAAPPATPPAAPPATPPAAPPATPPAAPPATPPAAPPADDPSAPIKEGDKVYQISPTTKKIATGVAQKADQKVIDFYKSQKEPLDVQFMVKLDSGGTAPLVGDTWKKGEPPAADPAAAATTPAPAADAAAATTPAADAAAATTPAPAADAAAATTPAPAADAAAVPEVKPVPDAGGAPATNVPPVEAPPKTGLTNSETGPKAQPAPAAEPAFDGGSTLTQAGKFAGMQKVKANAPRTPRRRRAGESKIEKGNLLEVFQPQPQRRRLGKGTK